MTRLTYIDEFRDGAVARQVTARIAATVQPDRHYHFMEFCGGHTHAIFRYGLHDLLPPQIHMIHGPGCPVCVMPIGKIDAAIALAKLPHVTLCSYGDVLRVPGTKRTSLLKARAEGADIRMVYSTLDALAIARAEPERHVVFFAIGFETTTPPTAQAIVQAQAEGLTNFSVFCNHVLTPAAMRGILDSPTPEETGPLILQGLVGPAHVSAVIGSQPYAQFAERDGLPVVIAGFEPLDMLQAILMLVRQVNDGRAEVENEYRRAVTPQGNQKAQRLVDQVFEIRDQFEWRGLGVLPQSALRIRSAFAAFDAEQRFEIPTFPAADVKSCACGQILRGVKRPTDCVLFATHCTPEHPLGSCMVSAEGACAAYYSYGRLRDGFELSDEQETA